MAHPVHCLGFRRVLMNFQKGGRGEVRGNISLLTPKFESNHLETQLLLFISKASMQSDIY